MSVVPRAPQLLETWLTRIVPRDGTIFVPQYAMRKDHRHILMSDWDFRFVSDDMPDCGVGGFDYKASNLEGEPKNASPNGASRLTGSVQKLGCCKEH